MEKIKKTKIINKNNEIFDYSSLEEIINSDIKDCICKIIKETKTLHKLKIKSGTGFFCNVSAKNIKLFITNNHILDQKFLDKENKLIYFNYNNEKKEMNLKLNRYKYTDELLDFTIIEVLKEDNITHFLEIDDYIYSKNYKNEQIFTFEFPSQKNLQYSHGKNLGKNGNLFLYSIGTLEGSSGSPILLIKNRKLIGIHKGSYNINKNSQINMGIPIQLIIEKIDYIKCIFNITKDKINKEIQIMNNKYYNYDLKKYLFNNEIENNIKILINGEIKSNIFKYKFYKEGKYTIYFFKTNSLIDMSGMFYECDSLEQIDLSLFKAEGTINISGLFSKCSSLEVINLKSFKSDHIRNMSWIFEGCYSLKEIDLSSFKTNKLKYMNGMFLGCSSLKTINLMSFKTERVINMSSLFEGCTSLKEIDLSSFKGNKVINISKMFKGCSSLKEINLYSFKINKVIDILNIFNDIPIFSNLICNDNKLIEEFNNRNKCILF